MFFLSNEPSIRTGEESRTETTVVSVITIFDLVFDFSRFLSGLLIPTKRS